MATAKKKTAPKKQATKKPAPKPRSMPAKVAKPKPAATQAVTEPKSSKKALSTTWVKSYEKQSFKNFS